MAKRAERVRNNNTETESMYWSKLRSALRRHYRYWKPAMAALKAASRPSKSKNKRLKTEYQCAHCGGWFPRKNVNIDHIEECGSLRCYDDLVPFLQRLTPEDPSAYQVLCVKCHGAKTQLTRKHKKG